MMMLRSDSAMPRGIRNNNPLNIRKGQDWEGETATERDPEFESFRSPEYGIRAAARIINNYRSYYGLTTVRGIISRWAPPTNDKGEFENDTESYIASVANALGVTPDTPLTAADTPNLISAMIYHENGQQPYSMDTIMTGVAMA